MSKKSCFTGLIDKQYGRRAQNIVEICTAAPLSYLFSTAKATELEKISLIDMPDLGNAY